MRRVSIAALTLAMLGAAEARAGLLVRIGDVDGFGYGTAPAFLAASGGSANVDGVGVLGDGDFLPDINLDKVLATGRGDDFDLRGSDELGDSLVTAGAGVTSTSGTVGSKFTDISLSTSYGTSRANNRVLIGGNPNSGLVFGAGGAFPDGSPGTLPNQPGFVFNFQADPSQFDPNNPIFFNLVFGDFDVVPASIRITRLDNSTRTITVNRQANNQDGLIQKATAELNYADVFTGSQGYLKVDFLAPNEPYTAFDFVELNTEPLFTAVPEPSTLVSGGIAVLVGLGYARRRGRGKVAHP